VAAIAWNSLLHDVKFQDVLVVLVRSDNVNALAVHIPAVSNRHWQPLASGSCNVSAHVGGHMFTYSYFFLLSEHMLGGPTAACRSCQALALATAPLLAPTFP
jgi:hypothetical protein